MTDSNAVAQVVIVSAQKMSEFEERLNQVLADIPQAQLLGIDYLHDTEKYGLIAFVRYLAI